MAYVSIPLAALNSEEYQGLTVSDRSFLIDLYVLFDDCETFTIEMDKPLWYRQTAGADLNRKVRKLIYTGLIEVVRTTGRADRARRVFAFKYQALQLEQAAA